MENKYTENDIKAFRIVLRWNLPIRESIRESDKNKADRNESQEMLDDSEFLTFVETWFGERNVHPDMIYWKERM